MKLFILINAKTLETIGTIIVSDVHKFIKIMNEELLNILEKVKTLYQKYGIKSVTMDDVSRELGISKKTLYQYVKDKNELVEMVVNLELETSIRQFSQVLNGELNAIEELFEVQKIVDYLVQKHNPSQEYDLKKYYPDTYKKIIKTRRDRMYCNILSNISKGKQQGVYRENLNEEIIAKDYVMRFENAVDCEIFTDEEKSSRTVFNELFIYHIRGIANEKGIKILEQKLKDLENNLQKIR